MLQVFRFVEARGIKVDNPAAAIRPSAIATFKARDRALSPEEIYIFFNALELTSTMPTLRLPIKFMLLTLVRKSEFIDAVWDEVNFETATWTIPKERMKARRPHHVYLSEQALEILVAFKTCFGSSQYLHPGRYETASPISAATLNRVIDSTVKLICARGDAFEPFTVHDLRRTASTHLHEAGFNSDWIEKCLAHERRGVRAIYKFARDWQGNSIVPKVIFIEPEYTDGPHNTANDDHCPTGMAGGQTFIADIYRTLISNPARWKETLLIVTYDEHGGFFDHAAPLDIAADIAGYSSKTTGLRVPAFLVSPYARAGPSLPWRRTRRGRPDRPRRGALRRRGLQAYLLRHACLSDLSRGHRQHRRGRPPWSGLPVVTMRPTVFLEGFFQLLVAAGVRDSDALVLPLGGGRTAPSSALDVAFAVALVLDEPAPHIGRIYNLTGHESADLTHFAKVFSEALGRTITYRDVPVDAWTGKLREGGVPAHLLAHFAAMARLHQQGRYDRMTEDFARLTGRVPMGMREFVQANAAEFTRAATTA